MSAPNTLIHSLLVNLTCFMAGTSEFTCSSDDGVYIKCSEPLLSECATQLSRYRKKLAVMQFTSLRKSKMTFKTHQYCTVKLSGNHVITRN